MYLMSFLRSIFLSSHAFGDVQMQTSYVRVKRKNQTFFIQTSPSDTFGYIKSEIAQAMGGDDDMSPEKMRLYIEPKAATTTDAKKAADSDDDDDDKVMADKSPAPKGPIPDEAILSDHDVKNDDVLFVTLTEGGDAWEEIDIAKPSP